MYTVEGNLLITIFNAFLIIACIVIVLVVIEYFIYYTIFKIISVLYYIKTGGWIDVNDLEDVYLKYSMLNDFMLWLYPDKE